MAWSGTCGSCRCSGPPPRQREAVVLRHLADLPPSDIAKAQGVTVGTVKASLYAAYRHLRVPVTEDEEVELDARR